MKLALLGADSESLALAEAAVAAGHSIVWAGDLAGAEQGPEARLAAEDRAAAWEDLHDDELCDAVIVGRGTADPELRLRQVQELARQSRPMLTTFPLFDSVLSYFEVDMARGEGKALVRHFNPVSWSGGDLAAWIRGGHPEFGRVEQVQCVRRLADRSRATVVRQFARDVDFLESVAGTINRIGAHGAAGEEAAYATLGVQLLGPSGLPIRWAVEPPEGREGMTLTLLCERGRATVECDADVSPAAARAMSDFVSALRPTLPLPRREGLGEGRLTLPTTETTATSKIPPPSPPFEGGGNSTWPAALHALEIADTIEISLRKGRMIEIHAQQLSEQLAFKGTMAAAGCGVLLVLIPLLMIIGWIAGLAGIPVARYWPHVLLVLLGGFLALQLLSKLIYAKGKDA